MRTEHEVYEAIDKAIDEGLLAECGSIEEARDIVTALALESMYGEEYPPAAEDYVYDVVYYLTTDGYTGDFYNAIFKGKKILIDDDDFCDSIVITSPDDFKDAVYCYNGEPACCESDWDCGQLFNDFYNEGYEVFTQNNTDEDEWETMCRHLYLTKVNEPVAIIATGSGDARCYCCLDIWYTPHKNELNS